MELVELKQNEVSKPDWGSPLRGGWRLSRNQQWVFCHELLSVCGSCLH